MPQMTIYIIGLAALVFVGVSATMNALFLSSLGRSLVEAALLASISVAADLTKLVLPIAVLRAYSVKAWTEMSAAALMLLAVTALSLASGIGFTALTRDASIARHAAEGDALRAHEAQLRSVGARLAAIQIQRAPSVIAADIAAARLDRRWEHSKSCTAPPSASARQYCIELARLDAAFIEAGERDRLEAEQQKLRASLDHLRRERAGVDDDPQASAIATLLGVDRSVPRVALVSCLTIILELGCVVLVLLASGVSLRAHEVTISEPATPFTAAEIPEQADRKHWLRQRVNSREQGSAFAGRDRAS